jgi:hypothetical protein
MCPIGFLMLGSTLQDLPSDSPAACRSACRRRRASLRTGSHQRTILACTRPILVGHAVELATAQPPPHDDGQVQTNASAGPAAPAPASSARRRLRQTTSRSWTQRATTPTPAIPAIRLPAHAALQDLTSAGHSARGNAQTPDADTGRRHRTPDSGHLDAQTPAPDTGNWTGTRGTPDARTGHWTPDAGHERGHGEGQHSRHPDLLGRHAEQPHAETRTRVVPSHHHAAAWSPRRPGRASAHCCPRTIAGRA